MSHLDLNFKGKTIRVTWDNVFSAAARINGFFQEVGLRFVEREDLLWKLKYAVCMGEHLMIIGPPGSAKSALVNVALSHIDGAVIWGMDFTRYTTETHLFGAYDQKVMRETGRMVHLTEGSMVDANFVKMGEFFDASDPTLRTLLGVLNERRVNRGTQHMKFPLVTGIADTNFPPEKLITRAEELEAVNDRFLFRVDVEYVEEPENRLHMLEMHLAGKDEPLKTRLNLNDVLLINAVVHQTNLVKDPYVKEAYQEATLIYNRSRVKSGRKQISDRRFVCASQIMEVSALMHRRTAVTFDDLWHTGYALVQQSDDVDVFEEALKASVERWVEKAQRRDIDRELHKLRELTQHIPQNLDLTQYKSPELKKLTSNLHVLLERLKNFDRPEAVEVGKELTDSINLIHHILSDVEMRMMDILIESLPDVEGPTDTLKNRFDHAQHIFEELQNLSPRANEALVKHKQAMHITMEVLAKLETEFTGRGRI